MRALPILVVLAGCTQSTLRVGVVMTGDRPAFQASVEMGPGITTERRAYQGSMEVGIESGGGPVKLVSAINADFVQYVDDDDDSSAPRKLPLARIGPRLRASGRDDPGSLAAELRGAVYTGMLREKRSGGFGIEVAGGTQISPTLQPIFELSIVMSGGTDP